MTLIPVLGRFQRIACSILLLLTLAACSAYRPSASVVAASKEAAARSASFAPAMAYGLEIESPRQEDDFRTTIPWLELRGRTGSAELFESDLVIVLDLSLNMQLPSGMDLDGDGVIGALRGSVQAGTGGKSMSIPAGHSMREGLGGASVSDSSGRTNKGFLFHPRNWTTDPDDTVVKLEIEAARRLIAGLSPRRNRIGLVTYAERGRTRTNVGAPSEAAAELETIRADTGAAGQNVSAGLRNARLLFSRLEDDGLPRRRAVLLFTDGRATYPGDVHIARLNCMYEADSLADRGIDLYVFAIGSIGRNEAEFLLELAGTGKGRVFRVLDPRRLLEDIDPLALAPRWLQIVNDTIDASAHGVRTAEDGRFDAFVPLAPGKNRIRVIAELHNGRLQRWEKDVDFQPPAVETEANRRAAEAVQQELDARAREPEPDPGSATSPPPVGTP